MTVLEIDQISFNADLAVLDKDGTLIDFECMWGRLAVDWVQQLTRGHADKNLKDELYLALGYDEQSQRTMPQSPLAVATTSQLHTIMAGTLFRFGIPWPEAETRVQAVSQQVGEQLTMADLVRPIGDLPAILGRLKSAGLRLAIVTTDDRAETEEQLRILGIAHLVEALVCGDDNLPRKPAPDGLLDVCQRLGVEPARTMVVGDTVADLMMARNAGAGLAVAVLTGADTLPVLRQHADVVLKSVDGIRVGTS
jgi:HAD superfamily hydrolase (TIGR01509 family)